MGGQTPREFLNDVWHSYDGGLTWTCVVEHAPWSGRAGHKLIHYEGELLLFSGSSCNFPRLFPGDIWASSDLGVTWTERAADVPWNLASDTRGRAGMEVVPLNDGGLYVMGGDNDNPAWAFGPNFADVWVSYDNAATFQPIEIIGDLWSPRTGHKCATPDGEWIYCFAGANQNGTIASPLPSIQDGVTIILHDVWKSKDGAGAFICKE